jgi:hypothetical protein
MWLKHNPSPKSPYHTAGRLIASQHRLADRLSCYAAGTCEPEAPTPDISNIVSIIARDAFVALWMLTDEKDAVKAVKYADAATSPGGKPDDSESVDAYELLATLAIAINDLQNELGKDSHEEVCASLSLIVLASLDLMTTAGTPKT